MRATTPPLPPGLTDREALSHYRRLLAARDDPAAFVAFAFADPHGRPLANAAVHLDAQAFLSQHRQALVELPRDHGKTLQVCGRVLWELGRNPALRVVVACATDQVAAARSRFLRDAVAKNRRVRAAFPELVPATPWAASAFTVARPADVVGPSVAAVGVGSGTTGARADLLICDDIVDVRALAGHAERERVKAAFFDNLLNLLEPTGRCWCLFTPWHPDDLNAHLKRNPAFALFSRPVGADLEPVWPEKWPRERLEERRAEIGEAAFARGYRLLPVSDADTPIRREWVRFWTEPAAYDRVILSVDPAVSASGKSDASALVVLGRTQVSREPEYAEASAAGGENNPTVDTVGPPGIHVLEAVERHVTAPDLLALMDELDRRWNPEAILFESNAGFAGVKDLLVRHARFGAKVKGVSQTRAKGSRVAALSVPVENGTVLLKGTARGAVDAGQRGLFEQMTTFPWHRRDDLVDALATGVAYLLDRREPRAW